MIARKPFQFMNQISSKRSWTFTLTISNKHNFSHVKIHKYSSKDVGSCCSELQLHTGNRSCFVMKSYSRWNIVRMNSFDQKFLQTYLLWFNIIKVSSIIVWAGIWAIGKIPLIFMYYGIKISEDVYQKRDS